MIVIVIDYNNRNWLYFHKTIVSGFPDIGSIRPLVDGSNKASTCCNVLPMSNLDVYKVMDLWAGHASNQ